MELTHILCIKVWSNKSKCVTDYNNIEKKIKNLIVDNEFTEMVEVNGVKQIIKITWIKYDVKNKMSYLISGDLVTSLKYSQTYDQAIYKHTEQVLNGIVNKLREDKEFQDDWEIIFNIVKPLSKTKPFIEPVYIWPY